MYNFRAVVEGLGVVKLYTTTENFLCFVCTFLPQNLHLVYEVCRTGFVFFVFPALLAGKHGQKKKIMLLNGFPKMQKTANPKTVATSLFIFPAKSCWLLTLFPIGEFNFFLIFKNLASHFKTEYNFKHAKSGSSQNCKYIKITDRLKQMVIAKPPGSFIPLSSLWLCNKHYGSLYLLSANIYRVLRPLFCCGDIKGKKTQTSLSKVESSRVDRHVNKQW